MAVPRREPAWRTLLRSRWLVLAIVLTISGGTAVFSKMQPKVYLATSTLLVNQAGTGDGSFDSVRATQAYALTLARLIGSRNVADQVSLALPYELTPREIQRQTDFTPVNETQLIEITASSRDPRQAEQLANTYATTFVRYVQTTIPGAAPTTGVSVADRAVFPPSPSRPKPTLYTLVALVLSSALAAALVLVRSRLDTRLHDADALSQTFDLPVLGVLPRTGLDDASERLLDESVRLLCSSMTNASERPVTTLVVTSARAGEGKSTVAAEIAIALASLSLRDRSVLAVDADLRRPTLHMRVGLAEGVALNPRRGLSTYLRNEHELDEVAVRTELASLRVLPTGPLPGHPSALLGYPTSRKALRSLADGAEYVVIDTPPLSVGADAALIAMDADAVLLVVDLNSTRAPMIRSALDQLENVGVTPLGFVVNRSNMRDRSSAYASYVQDGPVKRKGLRKRARST